MGALLVGLDIGHRLELEELVDFETDVGLCFEKLTKTLSDRDSEKSKTDKSGCFPASADDDGFSFGCSISFSGNCPPEVSPLVCFSLTTGNWVRNDFVGDDGCNGVDDDDDDVATST